MSPEKDNALVRDFPRLYRMRHADMMKTCMCWGFSCDDGWEPIIRLMSSALEPLIDTMPDLYADQVKEKWGSLCFYLSVHNEFTHSLQVLSHWLSQVTCERCGVRPARLYERRRISVKTLCEACGAVWVDAPPGG